MTGSARARSGSRRRTPAKGWPGTDGHQYTGYHGYWPIASTTLEKRFGDLAALKSMVAAAHKHGIRILVDSVLHHVHTDDPYWVQYQNDNWFTATGCVCGVGSCDWTIDATTCWFDTYLPTVDYLFDVLAMIDGDLLGRRRRRGRLSPGRRQAVPDRRDSPPARQAARSARARPLALLPGQRDLRRLGRRQPRVHRDLPRPTS